MIDRGITGASASTAAWNMAGRNRPAPPHREDPARWPHHVVPSGKTATTPPARNAPATSATVAGSANGRSRRTKIVPPAAASHPISGQRRTSCLASSRAGATARIARMSSHEM